MIIAYIGKMRSGKTYAMTRRVLKELNAGKVVYVNYRVKWNPDAPMSPVRLFMHRSGLWPKKRYPISNLRLFRNWSDVMNIAGATVALDEGWQYFDSYNKLPIEKRMRLYQSGKWEITYLYTVQRYMMADINLRWSTDEFWESTLYKIPFSSYPLLIYKLYDLDEDNEGAKLARKGMDEKGNIVDLNLSRKFEFGRKAIFEAYDTKEDIYATEDTRKWLGEKNDVRDSGTSASIDPIPTYWNVLRKQVGYADRRINRFTATGAKQYDDRRSTQVETGSKARRSESLLGRIFRRGNVGKRNINNSGSNIIDHASHSKTGTSYSAPRATIRQVERTSDKSYHLPVSY